MGAPQQVLEAYGWAGAELSPLPGGLINETYCVRGSDGPVVLQKLHRIFAPEVNLDIDAITRELARQGLQTPRLVRTAAGDAWCTVNGCTWRALTWIEGVTHHRLDDPKAAFSAGELVGRFHHALRDFSHDFAAKRLGVHDTQAHLDRLASRAHARPADDETHRLAFEILALASKLPPLPPLPRRLSHGDLKISNVLFDNLESTRARCLIDLDTLGYQRLAYELGDALRSWCNPAGEDVEAPKLRTDLLSSALAGYAAGSQGSVSTEELASVVPGWRVVCVELAARFCVDIYDDAYFGWDPDRFVSRRAHNTTRARGQLRLATTIHENFAELQAQALAQLASISS